MSTQWLTGLRGRDDRKHLWWALAAEGDLDKAVRQFRREVEEDRAERKERS